MGFLLATLPDDWYDEKSLALNVEALAHAFRVAIEIARIRDAIPRPSVVPCTDGGVQWEWNCGRRYLQIDIEPDGMTAMTYDDDDDVYTHPKCATPRDALALIDWVEQNDNKNGIAQ